MTNPALVPDLAIRCRNGPHRNSMCNDTTSTDTSTNDRQRPTTDDTTAVPHGVTDEFRSQTPIRHDL